MIEAAAKITNIAKDRSNGFLEVSREKNLLFVIVMSSFQKYVEGTIGYLPSTAVKKGIPPSP